MQIIRYLVPFWVVMMLCLPAGAQSSQSLNPVISSVRIVFSMVSHHSHLADRVEFYNTRGQPLGNLQYAVPHLVYEPLVTLYNPYNTELHLSKIRIRIDDPPLGFAFRKGNASAGSDVWLRNEFGSGQFLGLARFQIANENNASARKSFTLLLSGPSVNGSPGQPFTLRPGEFRTFSTWIESQWTWGLETSGGYTARAFFDWDATRDLTNRGSTPATNFGVHCVPNPVGHDWQQWPVNAGFQTDGLSTGARPDASRYNFEIAHNQTGNWVAMKLTDDLTVRSKVTRTVAAPGEPDFKVSLLGGRHLDPRFDLIKAFPMSLGSVGQASANQVIQRKYRIGDILQEPLDRTSGGKSPFAQFTMAADAQALIHNRFYKLPAIPPDDLYSLHFSEIADFHSLRLPLDTFGDGPVVHSHERIGNLLYIDFTGDPQVSEWKIRGARELKDGFGDNLAHRSSVVPGPPDTGIFKAIIDLEGLGPQYFIQIRR